jgi:hypothetical protein
MKYKIQYQEKVLKSGLASQYELTLLIPHEEINFIKGECRFAVLVSGMYHVTVAEPETFNNYVRLNFTWIANSGIGNKFMKNAFVYYKTLAIRLEYEQLRVN